MQTLITNQKNIDISIKNLKVKMGKIAKDVTELKSGALSLILKLIQRSNARPSPQGEVDW